ncbi:MAG: hypothetical protein LBG52_05545 [Candidatus Peribacteria bacterium]|jgi:pyruvate/2-oxoacid:ferredoxin oxidoreductase alpha subunit|nr:hypothetical protein [Candidatus Peribacteria bacterium]
MIGQAFNWADRYQHPVVFLVDKQLTEGYTTVEETDLVTPDINRGEKAESTS